MWSNGQSVVYTQCLFLEGLGLSVHTINQVHYSITTFATVCSDTWNVIVQSRLCLTGSLSPLRRGHPRGSKEALEGKNCAEGSLCYGHSRRNPKHTCKKCIHSFLRQMTLSLVINFTLIPFTWPPWWLKNLPARQETQVQSESGRSPGEGNGNPLQYPWLENPTNRGAWWATVHSPWGSQRVGHDRVTDTLVHSIPFTCSLPRNNF